MIESKSDKLKTLNDKKAQLEDKHKGLVIKKEKIDTEIKEVNKKLDNIESEIAVENMSEINKLIYGTEVDLKDIINALKNKEFSLLNEKIKR